jgi:hypothetical protein
MGSILGTRVQRLEDPQLVTAGGTYVEDIEPRCARPASPTGSSRCTAASATATPNPDISARHLPAGFSYDERADRRSWASMLALDEVFAIDAT